MGLGKNDESLGYFEEALKVQPDFNEALLYKGMALYLSGRVDEAMQVENFEKEFLDRFKDSLGKIASSAQCAAENKG